MTAHMYCICAIATCDSQDSTDRILAFGYRSNSSSQFASGECIMHTSPQPQFQTGSMQRSATMQASSAAYPRASGYGPIGHTINRMHQHSQTQPFPPPPPPPLPSPPPGTFTATAPSLLQKANGRCFLRAQIQSIHNGMDCWKTQCG